MSDEPKAQTWACSSDSQDVYRMKFASREEAIADLGNESGVVVRYERGFPREGLEHLIDVESILSGLESGVDPSVVIADFENGVFDTTEEQEEDLRRRIADAIFGWIKHFDPPSWIIVESEDIEVPTNAKNTAPQRT